MEKEHHAGCDLLEKTGDRCTCNEVCDGGVDISALWEKPCPKCGATEKDFCKFTGLSDADKTI